MARPTTKAPASSKVANARASAGARPRPNDNMNLYIMVGIIAAVIIVVGGVIYYQQSQANKTYKLDDPQFAAYAGIPLDDSLKDANREIDVDENLAEGVVQGITGDGIPYIGSPDAPVVFAEFADFSCPHCRDFEPTIESLVRTYVRTGQLRIEFYAVTFIGAQAVPSLGFNPSDFASRGALCAAEQGAFWEFHKEIFRYQNTQGSSSFTQSNIIKWAGDLGLDEDKMRSCMNSTRPDRALSAGDELRATYDVTGTPAMLYRAKGVSTWTKIDANFNILVGVISDHNNAVTE